MTSRSRIVGGMNKIKIKDDIIDLDCALRVTVTSAVIEIERTRDSLMQYEPGNELSQAEFDTLSAWLLNQTNHPYTVVIA